MKIKGAFTMTIFKKDKSKKCNWDVYIINEKKYRFNLYNNYILKIEKAKSKYSYGCYNPDWEEIHLIKIQNINEIPEKFKSTIQKFIAQTM